LKQIFDLIMNMHFTDEVKYLNEIKYTNHVYIFIIMEDNIYYEIDVKK